MDTQGRVEKYFTKYRARSLGCLLIILLNYGWIIWLARVERFSLESYIIAFAASVCQGLWYLLRMWSDSAMVELITYLRVHREQQSLSIAELIERTDHVMGDVYDAEENNPDQLPKTPGTDSRFRSQDDDDHW